MCRLLVSEWMYTKTGEISFSNGIIYDIKGRSKDYIAGLIEGASKQVDHPYFVQREMRHDRLREVRMSRYNERPRSLLDYEVSPTPIYKPATFAGDVYFLLDDEGNVVYVGKSEHGVRSRLKSHFSDKEFSQVWSMPVLRENLLDTERYLIRKFEPKYNVIKGVTKC